MSVVLKVPRGWDSRVKYEIRRTRSDRRCNLCLSWILRPDRYLVLTEFPGADAGYATTAGMPLRRGLCRDCAPEWINHRDFDRPDTGDPR